MSRSSSSKKSEDDDNEGVRISKPVSAKLVSAISLCVWCAVSEQELLHELLIIYLSEQLFVRC